MNELLKAYSWRYATKKYDSEKEISNKDYESIQEAIRLAPTSYGLQLFKVLEIESPELKEKLVEATWGQNQPVTASRFLVFTVPIRVTAEAIDQFVEIKERETGGEPGSLKGYGEFIKKKKLHLSDSENLNWMMRQAYIALGFGLTQAAMLKIDATPMEGFNKDKYVELLNLEKDGLYPLVGLALGYRSQEDQTQHQPIVRKAKELIFEKR
jgi:nitroreductase